MPPQGDRCWMSIAQAAGRLGFRLRRLRSRGQLIRLPHRRHKRCFVLARTRSTVHQNHSAPHRRAGEAMRQGDPLTGDKP